MPEYAIDSGINVQAPDSDADKTNIISRACTRGAKWMLSGLNMVKQKVSTSKPARRRTQSTFRISGRQSASYIRMNVVGPAQPTNRSMAHCAEGFVGFSCMLFTASAWLGHLSRQGHKVLVGVSPHTLDTTP